MDGLTRTLLFIFGSITFLCESVVCTTCPPDCFVHTYAEDCKSERDAIVTYLDCMPTLGGSWLTETKSGCKKRARETLKCITDAKEKHCRIGNFATRFLDEYRYGHAVKQACEEHEDVTEAIKCLHKVKNETEHCMDERGKYWGDASSEMIVCRYLKSEVHCTEAISDEYKCNKAYTRFLRNRYPYDLETCGANPLIAMATIIILNLTILLSLYTVDII